MKPRLLLAGCVDPTIDCIRGICEGDAPPILKQAFFETLLSDRSILLTPPGVAVDEVECRVDEAKREAVIVAVAGGVKYGLVLVFDSGGVLAAAYPLACREGSREAGEAGL